MDPSSVLVESARMAVLSAMPLVAAAAAATFAAAAIGRLFGWQDPAVGQLARLAAVVAALATAAGPMADELRSYLADSLRDLAKRPDAP
ncbi:MAG: hypothetical protein D6705_12010 [Deltaproteobacteria bacterium]|nr:MAG: hypothetical protein D6705_12010 [Deltaproteobacteria bacterium]